MSAVMSERIKVFWQPGCTSCLRTKEFLTKQGIDYESIDVVNDPDGMARLTALGARSIPVVAIGGRYTLCQSFGDVIDFLGLQTRLDMLPPEVLVDRLATVLETAARLVRQFDEATQRVGFRDTGRAPGATAFHLMRVAEMGIEATQQIELRFEGFGDTPPPGWTVDDIARWGESVRTRLLAWWAAETDRALTYTVPTYYGRRPMHDVLERTTWHAAQHCRQIALMAEGHGIVPDRPLAAATLAGLPVPDEVWG
ncbi:MAG: glutaredoxin domain-containing protein [Burkholderiaceae bacterium]